MKRPLRIQEGSKIQSSDVFDCSSLAVPPSKTVVAGILDDFVQQWIDLDERKVIDSGEETAQPTHTLGNANEDDVSHQTKRRRGHPNKKWGWHKDRLKLPYKFDYATRQSSPPPDDNNGCAGYRVVSLTDPSEQISYERELWELFRSVPTIKELEQPFESDEVCSNTRNIRTEITEGMKDNSRLDGHALSRLRTKDRHALPPPTPPEGSALTTIRVECWRRQLKKGSSPDPNRMELEFRTTQTLADVHAAMVELSQDGMWVPKKNEKISSGLFFIEDTFYTAGDIAYAAPILEWLDGKPNDTDSSSSSNSIGCSLVKFPRRAYLGIPPDAVLRVKSMEDARVDRIHLRLGVRYYHVHHGDVECSVFITDVCRSSKSFLPYPIIHDVWMPDYSFAECEACRRRMAALVTPPGVAMTHGGPTALCHSCYRHLFPLATRAQQEQVQIQKYNVWREQKDLSVGHDMVNALF